jgi:hypothetical protein
MSARATPLDMTVLSIGGVSQLPFFRSAKLLLDSDRVEGKSIVMSGGSKQQVKKFGVLTLDLMSTVSGSTRVANLDLTELLLGGLDLTDDLRSMSFNGTLTHAEGSGAGDAWKFPNFVGKEFTSQLSVAIPATSPKDLHAYITGATSAAEAALDFTLNSVNIEVPMLVTTVGLPYEENGIQMADISLEDRAVYGAVYPTVPTGTTSLLEKFFNAPQTGLTFAMTTKTGAAGHVYGGTFLPKSFSFRIEDAALVVTSFELASQGAVTGADGS